MDEQSGFNKERTDSLDLSARLKLSKLPETSEKTKWQKRYDARHYSIQQNNYEKTRQKNLQPQKRDYHNRW